MNWELYTALHTLFDVDVVRSTGQVDEIEFDETGQRGFLIFEIKTFSWRKIKLEALSENLLRMNSTLTLDRDIIKNIHTHTQLRPTNDYLHRNIQLNV